MTRPALSFVRAAVAAPLVLLAALPLASCGRSGAGGPGGFTMPPTPVEVAEVRPRTVRDQIRALGSIESDANLEIVSELGATVVRLPFDEGQPVEQGALLAQLDDREFRAEAERADAQAEKARADHARAQKLLEEHAIPQQGLDDARTAMKVADANAALARARFDKTRIRAPFAGLVGVRRVSPGAYLKTGDVITELTRVDEMKVTFAAPERYASLLRSGVGVEVTTPAWPGERFAGRVSAVNPVVDARSRTLQIVARIPNPAGRLRSGMSANVAVTLAERGRALVVPDEAVFAEGNQSFVFLVKPDSTVTRVAVELGTRDSSAVEVVRGLEPGARVVTAGHQKLFEGARVMPVSEPAGGAPARRGG